MNTVTITTTDKYGRRTAQFDAVTGKRSDLPDYCNVDDYSDADDYLPKCQGVDVSIVVLRVHDANHSAQLGETTLSATEFGNRSACAGQRGVCWAMRDGCDTSVTFCAAWPN